MDTISIEQPVFGNWYIEDKIGSGAFGTVYKIKREEFGETYYAALKVIRIPLDDQEISSLRSEGMDDRSITAYYKDLVQNLVSEIKILNSLKGNSNIVSYEDHRILEDETGTRYTILIRMELLTPLKEYMMHNPMDEEKVIKLGLDMCSALKLCEKNHIIHRDIKPDNIFVSPNGDFKLGDFGVAKTVEKTMSQMSKKGTATFMAPEVYFGKPYDHRADIYSLGLLLYQFLNHNRAPFLPLPPNPITFSDREKATAKRISGEVFPPLPIENQELANVVLKACSCDPSERQASAEEFYNGLFNAMNAERSLSESGTDQVVVDFNETTDTDLDKTVTNFDDLASPLSDVLLQDIEPAPREDLFEETVSPFDKINNQNEFTESEKKPPESQIGSEINKHEKQDFEKTISQFDDPHKKAVIESADPKPKNSVFQSFKLFFSGYTDFKGRTRRSDYWHVVLINVLINAVCVCIPIVGYGLLALYTLATIVPSIALCVRRLHDIGKSGIHLLLFLVPLAGAILMIVWFTTDSQPSENQYGQNPKM